MITGLQGHEFVRSSARSHDIRRGGHLTVPRSPVILAAIKCIDLVTRQSVRRTDVASKCEPPPILRGAHIVLVHRQSASKLDNARSPVDRYAMSAVDHEETSSIGLRSSPTRGRAFVRADGVAPDVLFGFCPVSRVLRSCAVPQWDPRESLHP